MIFGKSFSEVAGKRPGKPLTNLLDKMGPFKPTPAFCRMVEDDFLNQNALIAQPKSHFKNGLQISLAECDPMLIKEIAAKNEETFPDYTVASTKLSGGFFDIAFKTPNAADEAAKKILKAKGRFVPTVRTWWAGDKNLFVGFYDLPCTMFKNNLLKV